MEDQEAVLKIAQKLYERKAQDIVVLKVSHLTVLCDYMIIATGRTAAQVSALAEDVDGVAAEAGLSLRRSEGVNDGRWAVMDYGHLLVHLFHREERAFYNLEHLWNDGSNTVALPFDQTAD